MTQFLDGPAVGKSLTLSRAPIFLRVTESPGAVGMEFDALDQLDDVARPGERVHVYRIVGSPGSVHYDGVDRKTGKRFGRTEHYAEYQLHPVQPDQETLRDNRKWAEWCILENARCTLEAARDALKANPSNDLHPPVESAVDDSGAAG